MKLSLLLLCALTFMTTAMAQDLKSLASTNACEGKEKCLLVYVTPWCPVCKNMTPMFQQWIDKSAESKELGVKVFVGLEKVSGENEFAAKKYTPAAIIDQDASLSKIIDVNQYPTLLLVKNDGSFLMKGLQVIPWANHKLRMVPPPGTPMTPKNLPKQ